MSAHQFPECDVLQCIPEKAGATKSIFFFSWESEVLSLLHGAKMTRNCPIIIIALFFLSRKPLSSTWGGKSVKMDGYGNFFSPALEWPHSHSRKWSAEKSVIVKKKSGTLVLSSAIFNSRSLKFSVAIASPSPQEKFSWKKFAVWLTVWHMCGDKNSHFLQYRTTAPVFPCFPPIRGFFCPFLTEKHSFAPFEKPQYTFRVSLRRSFALFLSLTAASCVPRSPVLSGTFFFCHVASYF